MRYGDLVAFDPIETIIQLRQADASDYARQLVRSYVISDRMAEQLTRLMVPQLQFDTPADNRGLLIVGNYGTGKSHLMSVITALAENAGLVEEVRNDAVRVGVAPVGGRFKVVRTEIGAVSMSLRDIICTTLEQHLEDMGIGYRFPAANTVTNNKDAFIGMMAAFQQRHPNCGFLLAVDELLDFLRARQEYELVADLNFLREVGEVCARTRFRFMAGVQESLFDNPRFQFVAETLRRVRDRFEQVRISREDIEYVVAERLLRKDDRQRALIREHLAQFAQLYGYMTERMDQFVRLFPVHPAYLRTFEQIYFAEKREALKTLSRAMQGMLDQEVPKDAPGLISYDSYWDTLRDNPSFRTVPEIKTVIDRSNTLQGRIDAAFTRPQYKPVAKRLIAGLSVHRLTTGDINTPVGATAEELRDDLAIILPLPERDADFLKSTVETVLREIIRTVNGQFITVNPDNAQYYVDVHRDIDFDALVEQKADSLSEGQLNRYYFDALKTILFEDPTLASDFTGHHIWEHELEWAAKKVMRRGYLFFGAPNDRGTAQPPRDFYLYFLQPFDPPHFDDQKKPDEVFFQLIGADDAFTRALRLYAGARELAGQSSATARQTYEQKAGVQRQQITKWLLEHMPTAYEVAYRGVPQRLVERLRSAGGVRGNVRDQVNATASALLASHFQDEAPEYPAFSVLVTTQSRPQAAQDALRAVAGAAPTRQALAVLDALELHDGERLRPRESRYAKQVLELLARKGHGQVVNRAEIIGDLHGVEYDRRFRLEPEWIAVVLSALVQSGDLMLTLPGKKFDASALDELARTPVAELAHFRHVEKPKDLPLGPLTDLYELLDIPQGLLTTDAARDEGIKQLQLRASVFLERVAVAMQHAQDGIPFWGSALLAEEDRGELRQNLGGLRAFLESLAPYNSPARLKNFRHDSQTVLSQKAGLRHLNDVEELLKFAAEFGPLASYLATAEQLLPDAHPWRARVREQRADLTAKLATPNRRQNGTNQRQIAQTLTDLKREYADAYLALHARARLGANDDHRKQKLLKDARLDRLRKLAEIEFLHRAELQEFQNRLASLRPCYQLSKAELETLPLCPWCSFRPVEEPQILEGATAALRLSAFDDELDRMHDDWTRTLLDNLADPTVAQSMDALSPNRKKVVDEFLRKRELPGAITPAFVSVLRDVLGGLERISAPIADVRRALTDGGSPCTVSELNSRFEVYLETLARGKDVTKVRIAVE